MNSPEPISNSARVVCWMKGHALEVILSAGLVYGGFHHGAPKHPVRYGIVAVAFIAFVSASSWFLTRNRWARVLSALAFAVMWCGVALAILWMDASRASFAAVCVVGTAALFVWVADLLGKTWATRMLPLIGMSWYLAITLAVLARPAWFPAFSAGTLNWSDISDDLDQNFVLYGLFMSALVLQSWLGAVKQDIAHLRVALPTNEPHSAT